MKKFTITLLLQFVIYSPAIFCQSTIALTFTSEYYENHIPLDSIFIKNLSQGGDTVLHYPDTLLLLAYPVAINEFSVPDEYTFQVKQNHPNPFTEKTEIIIIIPETVSLNIWVSNIYGQNVSAYNGTVMAGIHTFKYTPKNTGFYCLSAKVNDMIKSIKMVCTNTLSDSPDNITYINMEELPSIYKSKMNVDNFIFVPGDQLQFIGYASVDLDISGSDVIESVPSSNEIILFNIVEGFPCAENPIVTYEGKEYLTVKIANQCWFKENVNAGVMIDVSQNQINNGVIEKYCHGDIESNCGIYGGLYQWDEMMQYYYQQGAQGICPEGWHIPADDDWSGLIEALNGMFVAGGKMKESGTFHWIPPNVSGNNESGFTLLPGGARYSYGVYNNLGDNTYMWSSTESVTYTPTAWRRRVTNYSSAIDRFNQSKENGYSVRCIKNEAFPTIPSVITGVVTDFTQISVQCVGEVTDDGGAEVSEKGFCWSVETYPTISDDHIVSGSGTGSFSITLTGLSPNTQYYLRAYAINDVGTVYGNQRSFTTFGSGSGEHCPGLPNITYDGQIYNTVQINDQCWLKENLNIGTMVGLYSNQTNNGVIEKYCYYDNPVNCITYGALYQWNELMNYTSVNGTQGICPVGWHVPTDDDFTVLIEYLQGDTIAGGMMKQAGSLFWYPPNAGATDESGFSALPAGERHHSPYFNSLSSEINLWSSTEHDYSYSWFRVITSNESHIYHPIGLKQCGYSLRCLKD